MSGLANAPPDDVVIEWARKQDVFSDQVVYEAPVTCAEAGASQLRNPAKKPRGPQTVTIDIDSDNLGSFREQEAVVECKRLGFVLIGRILSILSDGDVFTATCTLEDTEPVQGKSLEPPLRLSAENKAQLIEAGYFIDVSQLVMRYASFFLVAKANGHWRGVINGIPGNEVLAPPHYFTFFTPESWVRRLRGLGSFSSVAVDIKGQYNRLKWNSTFAHYYAVHVGGGRIMVPSVLAMGAKAAVSIGQSCSWLVVGFTEDGEDTLGLNMPPDPDMLPAVLDLTREGKVVGCIHVCVDNIEVCHEDDTMKQLWVSRLRRNARRFGLDPFKEVLHYDQSFCLFIGMHFCNGRWNHAADRMERWQRKYGVVPPGTDAVTCTQASWPLKKLSAKDLQRFVGVLVWDCRVRRLDVREELQEIFGIQYRACRAVDPSQPTLKEFVTLRKRWSVFQRNTLQEWVDALPEPIRTTLCVLASDASGGPTGRWSFCEMREGRVERDEKGRPINPSGIFAAEVPEPIYYREAHSLLRALRRLASQNRRQLVVVVVIDSAAVFGSLLKRMVPHRAVATFAEIRALCVSMEWTLVPKWIESLGNVCDSATHLDLEGRPLPICRQRERRTWEVAMSESYAPPGRSTTKRSRTEEGGKQ